MRLELKSQLFTAVNLQPCVQLFYYLFYEQFVADIICTIHNQDTTMKYY